MPRFGESVIESRSVLDALPIAVLALLATACTDQAPTGLRVPQSRPAFTTTVTAPDVYAYVPQEHGTVAVIRTSDGVTVANIALGGVPENVAVMPDGSYAYVTNDANGGAAAGTVDVIRTSDNAVVKAVTVGTDPRGVAITHDGSTAYVANRGDNSVSVIRTSDNTVVATVSVGTRPEGIAVTPDGSAVYVANNDGTNTVQGTVSIIRTSDRTVTTLQMGMSPGGTEGNSPHEVAITPNGAYAYVANDNFDGSVSVIRTSDNTIVKTVSVGEFPERLAITPDGAAVYVPMLTGSVVVIATSANTVSTSIALAGDGIAAAVTPDGAAVYTTSFVPDIAVIATATNTITKTLPLQDVSVDIAITPVAITLDLGQEVTDLQTAVDELANIGSGLTTSLESKLNAALAALAAGNTALACSDLQDFINRVKAQAGKKISTADATNLIDQATAIQTQLGC